jgi:hypothetical protein
MMNEQLESPASSRLQSLDDLGNLSELLEYLTPRELHELDELLVAGSTFDLASMLFGAQKVFVNDPATLATGCCSRRAGKTHGVAGWLLEGPITKEGSPSLYLTKTRKSAKRIVWSKLLELNRRYKLGYEANESDLILKRDGVGLIHLAGIDTKDEIEKVRGTGWGRIVVDEAQVCPPHIKELVEDVILPSLVDFNGQLRLIGTPAPVPAGYFYECTKSGEWSHHHWTVWDNPFIKEENKKALLEKTLRMRGVKVEHASIQREWFGRWVEDLEALVFKWNPVTNLFVGELKAYTEPWQYVMGVDLGYDDSDAIAVLAYHQQSPDCFLVEEIVKPKQTITPLMGQIESLVKKYDCSSIVMDTGGLGKKIAIEIQQRTGIAIKAAEKSRKFEFIELLNDALRTGKFKSRKEHFAHDSMLVEWDRDRSKDGKLVINEKSYHSDICDAVLYAYRESLHWTHEPDEKKTKPTFDEVAKELEEAAEERWRQQHEDDVWMKLAA